MVPVTCPPLPSAQAASDVVAGKPGGWAEVAGWTAVRAALVATGLYAVGERRHVVRNAVAGAVAIEAFVLAWHFVKCQPNRWNTTP